MREQPVILRYDGDGEFRPASGFWASQCDRHFVVGDVYRMTEHYERSTSSHSHFFAALSDAFDSLPDALRSEYPTVEHLRKKALIHKGFREERDHVCQSTAAAQRLAAFIKPLDDYAVVIVSESVVRVWTAKSQSKRAMGAKAFQESKQAVLDFVDDLLGVERGESARSAGYQHESSGSPVLDDGSDGSPALAPTVAADPITDPSQGGPVEAGGNEAASVASPASLPPADKRVECLNKMLALAGNSDLTVKERRDELAFVKDAWKEALPDHLEFVRNCLTQCDKVAKGELPTIDARRYLEGLL